MVVLTADSTNDLYAAVCRKILEQDWLDEALRRWYDHLTLATTAGGGGR